MTFGKSMKRRSFLSASSHAILLSVFGNTLLYPDSAHADAAEDETLYVCSDFTAPGGFTSGVEGPACDIDGNLYAVNFSRQGTIGKVSPDGTAEIFVSLPEGSVGNGIRFNSHDTMLIADYTAHNILSVDMITREISVLANEPTMNQPNDIAITSKDVLFASDPNWGKATGNVWRIDADGVVMKLDSLDVITNGIEVSPDETKLYVNTSTNSARVFVYDLDADGNVVSDRRLLVTLPGSGIDGMRCDVDGNLYITRNGQGIINQVSPDGEIIRSITTKGKRPSNIAFGGIDGRTCYLTMADRGCIEMFRTAIAGRSWQMFQDRKPISVAEDTPAPAQFSIQGNLPNPFNASTTIEYTIGEGMTIELSIFNSLGQKVEVLERGFKPAGRYASLWNGNRFPSGVYFCVLSGNGRKEKRKMMLLK